MEGAATFEPTLKCFCTQSYLAASAVPGSKLTQHGLLSVITPTTTPQLKLCLNTAFMFLGQLLAFNQSNGNALQILAKCSHKLF